MKTTLKIGSLALVLVSAASLFAQSSKWPTIRPLEEKKVFINPGQNNTDTPFAAFIKDSNGVPVYKLECHNGNYEDESEINFSGDFQCALFAVKGATICWPQTQRTSGARIGGIGAGCVRPSFEGNASSTRSTAPTGALSSGECSSRYASLT